MTRIIRYLMITLLAVPAFLVAQTALSISDSLQPAAQTENPAATVSHPYANTIAPGPFSRLAFSGGIGIGGINMQAAVEANRYLNIRGIGNYFSHTLNNITVSGNGGSNGFKASGKLNLAELGLAADYYPFPSHGFRVSPGLTLYNANSASVTGTAATGSSITLGSVKYYSDSVNPMSVVASLGLNAHQQAFSLTTGWGNMISRRGGSWAFPFEVGAIFTGVPTVKLNVSGYGCTVRTDAAINGPSCVNMATNAAAQTNLNSQIAKYHSDLDPLKVYPILSFGVSYNFKIRGQ